jgi:hypothetical protein
MKSFNAGDRIIWTAGLDSDILVHAEDCDKGIVKAVFDNSCFIQFDDCTSAWVGSSELMLDSSR